MLLHFSVENFLSIKDEQEFSMVATNLSGHEEDNLFAFEEMRILRSAVIYGSNASGKSNLIAAMSVLKGLVRNSVQNSVDNKQFPFWTFNLDEKMKRKPVVFEITFVVDAKVYYYQLRLLRDRVIFEELSFLPNSRKALLFRRQGTEYKYGSYFKEEAKGLEDKTNPQALFLTVAAQFNSTHAKKVMSWFDNFNVISRLKSDGYKEYTANKIQEDFIFKQKVSEMLRKADMGIESVEAKRVTEEDIPDYIPKEFRHLVKNHNEVFIYHKAIASDGSSTLKAFNLDMDESEGTKKYFALAGPIVDTLMTGGTLIVDELDSKLHPLLTRHIVQLFNSKDHNPKNAQLIFATHDMNLLSLRYFRRDQIWFVDKGTDGASSIYSLSDFKDEEGKMIRKDTVIQNDYFQGKFDAIPFIGH